MVNLQVRISWKLIIFPLFCFVFTRRLSVPEDRPAQTGGPAAAGLQDAQAGPPGRRTVSPQHTAHCYEPGRAAGHVIPLINQNLLFHWECRTMRFDYPHIQAAETSWRFVGERKEPKHLTDNTIGAAIFKWPSRRALQVRHHAGVLARECGPAAEFRVARQNTAGPREQAQGARCRLLQDRVDLHIYGASG